MTRSPRTIVLGFSNRSGSEVHRRAAHLCPPQPLQWHHARHLRLEDPREQRECLGAAIERDVSESWLAAADEFAVLRLDLLPRDSASSRVCLAWDLGERSS